MKKKRNVLKRALDYIHIRKLRNYRPGISLQIDKQDYIIKTAENGIELQAALTLRYEIFIRELLQKTKWLRIDFDRFDLKSDHLLIIRKSTGMIIGTYRMNSTLFSRKFYSATEFDIREILRLPGNKLEIDRACVHQDFRNGRIIAYLLEGIIEYAKQSDSGLIFGCSSIRTMDKANIRNICEYLAVQGHIANLKSVVPKRRFRIRGLNNASIHPVHDVTVRYDDNDIKDKIPTLIYAYLKAGAKLCPIPALDKRFRCVDFMTVLDVKQLSASMKKITNN